MTIFGYHCLVLFYHDHCDEAARRRPSTICDSADRLDALVVVITTWLVDQFIGFATRASVDLTISISTRFALVTLSHRRHSFAAMASLDSHLLVGVGTWRRQSLVGAMLLSSLVSTVSSLSMYTSAVATSCENSSDWHSAISNFFVSVEQMLHVTYVTTGFLTSHDCNAHQSMIWQEVGIRNRDVGDDH